MNRDEMNQDDAFLRFVKGRLEEGEGIAPTSLESLMVAARRRKRRPFWGRSVVGLLAASLTVAAGGWLALVGTSERRRVADLENALALVRVADGYDEPTCESLADNLLAFQDAPLLGLE